MQEEWIRILILSLKTFSHLLSKVKLLMPDAELAHLFGICQNILKNQMLLALKQQENFMNIVNCSSIQILLFIFTEEISLIRILKKKQLILSFIPLFCMKFILI